VGSKDALQVVFHTGAKKRADAAPVPVDDPTGMLTWPASDRAVHRRARVLSRRPAMLKDAAGATRREAWSRDPRVDGTNILFHDVERHHGRRTP
jgi:hypothetical protein